MIIKEKYEKPSASLFRIDRGIHFLKLEFSFVGDMDDWEDGGEGDPDFYENSGSW